MGFFGPHKDNRGVFKFANDEPTHCVIHKFPLRKEYFLDNPDYAFRYICNFCENQEDRIVMVEKINRNAEKEEFKRKIIRQWGVVRDEIKVVSYYPGILEDL